MRSSGTQPATEEILVGTPPSLGLRAPVLAGIGPRDLSPRDQRFEHEFTGRHGGGCVIVASEADVMPTLFAWA